MCGSALRPLRLESAARGPSRCSYLCAGSKQMTSPPPKAASARQTLRHGRRFGVRGQASTDPSPICRYSPTEPLAAQSATPHRPTKRIQDCWQPGEAGRLRLCQAATRRPAVGRIHGQRPVPLRHMWPTLARRHPSQTGPPHGRDARAPAPATPRARSHREAKPRAAIIRSHPSDGQRPRP